MMSAAVTTKNFILTLEKHFLSSAPALTTQLHPSGWLIRSSAGYTKRADLTKLMGSRKVIRITPLAHEDDDAFLGHLGWHRADPSIVMVRPLDTSPLSSIGTSNVISTGLATPQWIDGYATASELLPSQTNTLSQTLSLIEHPSSSAYLTIKEPTSSHDLAYGQVVKSGDIVGIFNIVVPKAYRGRGYGGKIAQSLLDWGVAQGAKMAYLQVTEANVGARRLYEVMGFKEAYPYHYRIAPEKSMEIG